MPHAISPPLKRLSEEGHKEVLSIAEMGKHTNNNHKLYFLPRLYAYNRELSAYKGQKEQEQSR